MKIKFILIFVGIVCTIGVFAQTSIRSGTELKAKGIVSMKGSLSNGSDKTDLTEAQLILSGTNQTISTTSPLTIQALTIEGGGDKTTKGELTITDGMTFTDGIVTPASGKLLYTGSTTLSSNPSSYVNGPFYQRGTGLRFFPIGTGSTYMPMKLNEIEDGNAEIRVEAFATGTNLTLPANLSALASDRHWEVEARGGSVRATSASLYVTGSSIDASQRLVVVEAEAVSGATAVNLGGGVSGDFVASFSPATKPILTIGIAEKADLRIMDLITPFNSDNINDKLKIVNIEYTYENKVTLLDRWGVPVREWNNFTNYDNPTNPNPDTFDFTRLSPGNYICVLQYKLSVDAPEEELSQMITVLKGN
jgi:CHU_C Type IX secretion signal domain